jgi:hypothetical protein
MKYNRIKKSLIPSLQETILCACGCGRKKDRYDKHGREILFLKGHGKTIGLEEQFLKFVIKNDNGCWGWSGATISAGYGCFRNKGILYYAHRYSYEFYNNIILSADVEVLHSCDNPACSNPDHLTAGSHLENMHDAISKNRINGIPLSDSDVVCIRGLHENGMTQRAIADQFGNHPSYISRIVRMERRQGVTSL